MFTTPLLGCFSIPTHHLLLIYADQWRRDIAVPEPLFCTEEEPFQVFTSLSGKCGRFLLAVQQLCPNTRIDDVSAMGLAGTSTTALLDYNSFYIGMALAAEGHAQWI